MIRKASVAAAVAFIAFLIVVIIIADRGEGGKWWAFIDHIPKGDKVGHLGLIGTLSLLCNLAFHPRQPGWLPRWITPITLILLVILSGEEIAQAFIPTRTCDLFDWLADLAGLAAGQTVALWLRARIFS
mgnify:CR=1 FL=1|jgi:VanZ family protein